MYNEWQGQIESERKKRAAEISTALESQSTMTQLLESAPVERCNLAVDKTGLEEPLKKLGCCYWVAVKELKLIYYIGDTLLFTIYTHYGNLV